MLKVLNIKFLSPHCPVVVHGEDGLQIQRTAAYILNKQSWTADRG
jgi:hypothetical protein